jgi:2'-5' RNA ligase
MAVQVRLGAQRKNVFVQSRITFNAAVTFKFRRNLLRDAYMSKLITKRNIVIIPDAQGIKKAIELSRQISQKFGTSFVLDGKNFYPHITLYQTAYPTMNLTHVVTKLSEVSRTMKSFRVQIHGYKTMMGFIFLHAIRSRELFLAHKHIVSVLNPLREGAVIPSDEAMLDSSNVSHKIKHCIRTYGSILAMDTYMPHITLCRLKDPNQTNDVFAMLPTVDLAFDVRDIYLANVGQDGSVNEILERFPLFS